MHETYATTLAVGSDIGGEEGLAADHTTSGYLAAGQALAAGSPGESGRFRVDAVLRCLMAPAQLSDLTGRLASIWIADLNHPDGRPDRGLALIDASVIETVPAPETFGLHCEMDPGPFVRAMVVGTVVLTTASTLMVSPSDIRCW